MNLPYSDKLFDFFSKNPSLSRTLAVLGALYSLKKGAQFIESYSQRKLFTQMEQIGAEYQLSRDQQVKDLPIPSFSQIDMSNEQIELILNSSALELAVMLQKGEVTSENLVNIFSYRCQTIGHEYKAITEMNYEQAISMARSCDSTLNQLRQQVKLTLQSSSSTVSSSSSLTSSNSSPAQESDQDEDECQQGQACIIIKAIAELYQRQPLFGVPVSIKDIIEMKGFAVTIGCVNRKDKLVEEDTLIIRLIKNSGAIPFVRSNIPQLNMATDCFNRLYGRTCNAWDKSRYSGGSSGGEATLIASRCSPLGFGTDIGGSIRIPACLNGIVGFKPTSGRTPFKGLGFVSNCIAGQLAIRTSLGPMGRFVDDVAVGMKVITNEEFINKQKASQRGAYQPMMQTFDLKKYNDRTTKYRIGYIKSYKLFDACEAYQRGVDIAVDALRSQGHELIPIDFPFEEELTELYFSILSSDNNRKYYDQLGQEDFIQEYASVKFIMKLNPLARRFIIWLLRKSKQNRMADIIQWCPVNRTAEEFLALSGKLANKREEIIRYFEQLEIDGLITPGQAIPAFKHGLSSNFMMGSLYTHIWNTLNFTAGVLPVTKILPQEQNYPNSNINDKISKLVELHMADSTAGLPVNAQVITLPYQEELCLNLMKQIENKVNFYKNNKTPI